jgi:hypothetical protein
MMPNTSRAVILVASCAALAMSGCGTSFDRERQRTLYEVQTHDYGIAAARINGLYGSNLAGEPKSAGGWTGKDANIDAKQELLWRMERGLVSSLAGDLRSSDLQLDAAAKLVDARRTKSIAAETGTYLLNDNVRPFAAHGYEAIQVDYYRILSQLTQAERAAGLIHTADAASPSAAEDHYQKASIRARRMTLDELKETSDEADQHRYRDDPFARFLAGMVTYALPPGSRGEDDEQFTQVMFKRSLDAYLVEQHTLDHDRNFRWEVGHRPHLVERMFLRHCLAYDAGSYADSAKHFGLNPEPKPVLPEGYGSVLVLNHVGFISRPQVLSIGFGSFAPPLSAEESSQGCTNTSFNVAGMGFWAKGPDSEVAGGWVVDLPEDIIKHMTPGGMAIFGLQLPVDAREEPIAPPARVSLRPVSVPAGGSDAARTVDAPMEVVSDLDAYARATLKDEQPRLLTKTIIRAVTKQILAAEAAVQSNKAVGGGAEGQALETVVNLFGSAAATFSELADTRAWTTLPDHVEAALIDLPAGGYSLEVEGAYGTTTLGTIEIRPGQVLVVPARTFPQPIPNPN